MGTASAVTTNRAVILAQAQRILNQTTFTKEDSSRVEGLLSLADAIDGAEARFAKLRVDAQRAELGLSRDSRLIQFFSGRTQADTWGVAVYREKRDMDTSTGAGSFGSPLAA